MIRSSVVVAFGAALIARAQVPVPFTTDEDRFMVFANRRFEKLEPRVPQEVHAMEGQVLYRDHEGRLKVFLPEGRRLHLLDSQANGVIRSTRSRIVWNNADTIKTVREGRAVVLMNNVERFAVSDSLVVYIDSNMHHLSVLWKNRSLPLADVTQGSERAQWVQGSNTVAFFNKSDRRLSMFYRGQVKVLCDSTDVGIVSAGGDVIGYWDGNSKRFMAMLRGEEVFLSDVRPASVKAGAGMLAFVDGNGRLKCFANGEVHTVLDRIPSGYWVNDSMLTYLDDNRFMLFDPRGSILVEPYVPERWQVEGGMLVYLNINRELHSIRNGKRERLGSEASIASFDLFGESVRYRSPLGNTVVVTPRRTYVF
ncbi:MAG: hypothetical protein IPL52_00380 [Flavobacteriales bacterium]|nr:hypothetical protein [Flavobacteriales bacterium]